MAAIDIDRIRAVYTAPYYLSMLDLDEAGLEQFVRIAGSAELEEVLWMLDTEEWRCRKVGAWFALARDEAVIDEALSRSLLTSRGNLTAPELGVALVQRIGAESLPLLLEYQSIGVRDGHGRQGVISALIESLGGSPLLDEVSELERARIAPMRELAARIASR